MPKFTGPKDSPESPVTTDSEEEETVQAGGVPAGSGLMHLASQISSTFGSSPSKRRLPVSSGSATAPYMRDAKSRRREETGSRRMHHLGAGVASGGWAEGKEKRDKDDLIVDVQQVEHLRKCVQSSLNASHRSTTLTNLCTVFGDPFLEVAIKEAA
jgi:hypothetical protein